MMIDSNNTLTIDTNAKNNYYDINNDNNKNSGDDNNLFGVSYYYNNIMNKRIQFYYRESIIDRSFVKYHVDVNDHDRVSNEASKLLVSSSASQSPLIASPSLLKNPDISDSTNIGFLTSSSEATAAAAAKPTSQSSAVPISSSLSLSSSTTTAASTYAPSSLLPIKTEMYLSSPQILSASSQSLSQQQQQQQQQQPLQQASIPQLFDNINHDAQDNKNNTIVEPKSIKNNVSCTTKIDAYDQTKTVDITNNGTGIVESSVHDDINVNNNRTSINYNDNDDGGIVSSNVTMSKNENDKSNSDVILNDNTDNKNSFDFSTDNNDNQEINILSHPRSQHLIDDIMYDADSDNEDEDIFNRIVDDADDTDDNDDSASSKNSMIHSMDRKFDQRMIKNSYRITGNYDDDALSNKNNNNAYQVTELTAETQPQLLQIQPSSSTKSSSSSSPMLSRSFSQQQPEQEQLNSNLLVFNQYKLRNKSINIETIFEEFNNDHIDYDYSEHLKTVSLKNSAILLGWKVMMMLLSCCLTIMILTT